jgi:hypothetical protein
LTLSLAKGYVWQGLAVCFVCILRYSRQGSDFYGMLEWHLIFRLSNTVASRAIAVVELINAGYADFALNTAVPF